MHRESPPPPNLLACRLFSPLTTCSIASNSLLPTHSPVTADKDRLSPLPPSPPSGHQYKPGSPSFNTGCFTNTPQYVAVLAGRRSSRFREWRSTSLESVQEEDEKREEQV